MHAVLRRLAPHVTVIDLSHEIPPFDVFSGAEALSRAIPHLGPGVVLGIVDPGVGGSRRGVAFEAGGRWFVGPDNGLLTGAAELVGGITQAIELRPSIERQFAEGPGRARGRSATFDGRDVFAPAVAGLCNGLEAGDLGAMIDHSSLVRLPAPHLRWRRGVDGVSELEVAVTWIDRFGNVQVAAGPQDLPGRVVPVQLVSTVTGTLQLRAVRSFSELTAGELGLLVDANGRFAIVSREESAAKRTGLQVGDIVRLIWS